MMNEKTLFIPRDEYQVMILKLITKAIQLGLEEKKIKKIKSSEKYNDEGILGEEFIFELEEDLKKIGVYFWPGGNKSYFSVYETEKETGSLFDVKFLYFNENDCWNTLEDFVKDCSDTEIIELVKKEAKKQGWRI